MEGCIRRRPAARAVFALAIAASLPGAPRAAGPSLNDVLSRTAEYVVAYGKALSHVVAEETYTQQLQAADGRVETRVLRSEFIFIELPPGRDWMGFRDVFEVDGRRVHDREDRMQRLFLDHVPADAMRRLPELAGESARFNIGNLRRTLLPTMVLHFVQRAHRSRFRFEQQGETLEDGRTLWVVGFRERDTPTFVRTPQGRSIPATGRLWVEPASGRLWRTEVALAKFAPGASGATMTVDYRMEPGLALLVPDVMREEYRMEQESSGTPRTGPRTEVTISGRATYDRYRRFQTDAKVIVR